MSKYQNQGFKRIESNESAENAKTTENERESRVLIDPKDTSSTDSVEDTQYEHHGH
jgi:hypothetical protein